MDEETRIETLPCPLTEAELLARADEAARLEERRQRCEAEREVANRAAKANIQKIEEALRMLLGQVRRKSEEREIQVIDRRNEEEKAMEVVRIDTGEVVRSRPMTPDELQLKMFDRKPGAKKEPA